MKNSKEYGQKLQKLYRGLKRSQAKVRVTTYDEPIEAIIYGVISEKLSDAVTQATMKGMRETFVDWNDLRVSRVEEIVEVINEDNATSRAAAASLTTLLRAIFDDYHTLSLEPLKKIGKRPAKQALDGLQGISHYVVSYCMLTSLQAHAIPLTEAMVEYLKLNDIVDPEADDHDIEGFLTRQVAAKDAYEFYALLRHESEVAQAVKKKTKKKTTKKVAKKKVTKKKTTKKKTTKKTTTRKTKRVAKAKK